MKGQGGAGGRGGANGKRQLRTESAARVREEVRLKMVKITVRREEETNVTREVVSVNTRRSPQYYIPRICIYIYIYRLGWRRLATTLSNTPLTA